MNIIVNGGTRGIGREVVLNLARNTGHTILVTGRNKKELNKLSLLHQNVKSLVTDLSDFDSQAESFRKTVTEHFKKVDVLINIAGIVVVKEFMDISNDERRRMMETNFFGPASVIRIIIPLMHKGSHIVNISSMGGFQGSSKYNGLSYYSASKAALACLTECLSTEFMKSGIKVNCLALGSVQTEMFEQAFPGHKAPVDAREMAEFVSDFALNGHRFFNGKILPVALSNP